MTSFHERLADAVERSGRSHRDISIAAGLGPGIVNEILKNPQRSPSIKNVQALARVLGVSSNWLIEGDRDNMRPPGFSETQAIAWEPPPAGGERADLDEGRRRLLRTLAPDARTPLAFRLTMSLPDLALLHGDVLIIDGHKTARDGDTVVATVADLTSGAATTVVRRLFGPYLVGGGARPDEPVIVADGARTVVIGVVCASFRAPQLTG